jgi:DNA-binding MarR family transcriptional regulator
VTIPPTRVIFRLHGSTEATLSCDLQRPESRGLIRLQADPVDGRGKLVSLTAAGRKMREKCIREVAPLPNEIEQEFGEQKFCDALPLLEELRRYLDEHRPAI